MVLSRVADLMLCRSIWLLALLARGDGAKNLEILARVTSSPCSAARSYTPG